MPFKGESNAALYGNWRGIPSPATIEWKCQPHIYSLFP